MRSPEEGATTGAGPGTGNRASGQRLQEDMMQERPSSQWHSPYRKRTVPADVVVADQR